MYIIIITVDCWNGPQIKTYKSEKEFIYVSINSRMNHKTTQVSDTKRGSQEPYIEKGYEIQWLKEKCPGNI